MEEARKTERNTDYWADEAIKWKDKTLIEAAKNRQIHARLAEAEALLKRIRPGAMFASCQYKTHEDAEPTFHCCDWNEVVEEIEAFLLRIAKQALEGGGE